MPPRNVYLVLTRLLAIVGRSFPQYLRYSRPYVAPGKEAIKTAIDNIAKDQDGLTERISQMLIDADAPLRTGEFPMQYTDTHDLGIDYQLKMAIEYQRQDIQSISALVEQLQLYPAAKSLAEEALGMSKGHLDTLLEFLPENSPAIEAEA